VRFRLDHVVIAVSDLAKAVEDYRALGFTVQRGGRHPGRTSHNALVVFEDGAYLELIAWQEPGPAERWYNEHARHGDGLMDFALLPEDTARAIEEAKGRGLALTGPLDGGRVRPDGRELKWQTARQATFDLPFLCGDITPRELRVPEGEARRHPNGATGVASLTVAVRDLDASLSRYAALLGLVSGGPERDGMGIGARTGSAPTATVTLGPTAIVLAQRQSARGEGPCDLVLRAPGGGLLGYHHGNPQKLQPFHHPNHEEENP
jgi:catechol 2,3-dioxygenase-like lactoylglutathione lyase family enzyme